MICDASRRQHSNFVPSSPPPPPLDSAILNTPVELRLDQLGGCWDFDDSPIIDDFWMSTPDLQHQDSSDWVQPDPSQYHPQNYSAQPDFYSYSNQTNGRSWQQGLSDAFPPHVYHQTSPQSKQRPHRRALSNSTVASQTSTSSPQSSIQHQRHLLDPHHFPQFKNQYYPTPTGTPTQEAVHDTFMEQVHGGRTRPQVSSATSQPTSAPASAPSFQQYPPQIRTSSGPQFQSYYGQSYMNTPTSAVSAYEGDTRFGGQPNGQFSSESTNFGLHGNPSVLSKVPRLEPTMTQACADELYSPGVGAPQQQQTPNLNLLTPSVHERLQAANDARQSRSPIDGLKRDPSPYKEGSHYLQSDAPFARLPDGSVGTAAQQRAHQKWQDDQYQQWRHHHRGQDPQQQPQTISPKDAYVDDFHDPAEDSTAGAPLFPQRSDSSTQQLYDDSAYRSGYGPVSGIPPRLSASTFSFAAPNIPASASLPSQSSRAYGGASDFKFAPIGLQRQDSSSDPDPPAHLISMETSKSDADSSQETPGVSAQGLPRPQHRTVLRGSGSISAADTGTYSCTYVGCPQRFATPALLQKHKRDAHRPTGTSAVSSRQTSTPVGTSSPVTAGSGTRASTPPRSTSTQAQAQSQAGPHRCDRINPSTGKSCNTVFSRPYDLTRHEDTIHARRPKSHCQYCAERGEEKTFSRADALTRHLRVVHPEVEVFGKLGRRRGL